MMNSILNSINEKRAHLIGYETFSYQLLNSDLDELNNVFDQREMIIKSINHIDLLINNMIDQSNYKNQLHLCRCGSINRNEVIDELKDIYDGFESIHDSLLNIQKLEIRISERLSNLKDELYNNLVQVENVSKIKKYFETYETEMQDMTQMVRKSTKI
ncbi:MAG: hypothetical protein ACYDEI_09320 [Erysipelotrichaceae bacterium]